MAPKLNPNEPSFIYLLPDNYEKSSRSNRHLGRMLPKSRLALFWIALLVSSCYVAWSHFGGLSDSYYAVRQIAMDLNTGFGNRDDSSASCAPVATKKDEEFDWFKITPSTELKWTPCYDGKQCARLSVPLDYFNADTGNAVIALAKIPSAFSPDSKSYRGPVLFNPGGPGGSGVSLIQRYGDLFAQILGNDYDLIGFDPRGVGNTIPHVSFFLNDAERTTWDLQEGPLLNSTDDSFARADARAKLVGLLASEEDRSAKASQYVSTAVVARDMLQITRAHGREKLQYIGFSYGTVLGATYAAMFPDNIERLVIDGVMEAPNYYETLWNKNLLDTQKTLQYVFDSCSEAGPGNCPLYEPTPALVEARVRSILGAVKARPVYVRGPKNVSDYAVVDHALVKEVLFGSLYKPFKAIPAVIDALAALEKGDGAPFSKLSPAPHLQCDCKDGPAPLPVVDGDASTAIRCSDGVEIDDTLEDYRAHFEKMSKQSEFADLWSTVRVTCSGFKIRPSWRFAGPFVANTSFPLLIIGNTADPVTPLAAAHAMSKGFTDSVVLTQNSPGHCSLSGTSLCTQKAIRAYFRDGILPAKGTTCEIRDKLFSGNGTQAIVHADVVATSEEDFAILDALKGLTEGFEPKFPLKL